MLREVEISSLDLRYERLRMKNRTQEGRLLSSIAERGIECRRARKSMGIVDGIVRLGDG